MLFDNELDHGYKGASVSRKGQGRLRRGVTVGLVAIAVPASGAASAAAVAVRGHSPPAAALAPNPVAISPAPGTPDASPQTQISLLGLRRARIRGVTVRGARSGRHAGRLRGYRGVSGASFLLHRPLAQGEHV